MKRNWNIALGFYQNQATARSVISRLQKRGFSRIASIYHAHDDQIIVNVYSPFKHLAALTLALFFSVLILAIWLPFYTAVALLVSVIAGYYLIRHFFGINRSLIDQYKNLVARDEVLVILEIRPRDYRIAISFLREVSAGHPITFLLRSTIKTEITVFLPNEPLTLENLRKQARSLADSLQRVHYPERVDTKLLENLGLAQKIIQEVRFDIGEAEFLEQAISNAAERLLDNNYVVLGSVEDIRKNLPFSYYKELPKILGGSLGNLPRVYAIAIDIIDSTAGKLSKESLIEYLNSYQTIQPLTIGELYALPLFLRLRLVECVESFALQIDNRIRETELANFWGNRILYTARSNPSNLPNILELLSKEVPYPSALFAENVLDHLFDETSASPIVKKYFEDYFTTYLEDVIHVAQTQEAGQQVAFANVIGSLFTLVQLSWTSIFEAVSRVDAILSQDPLDVYTKMTRSTRSDYRKILEQISKGSKESEVAIANHVLEMAKKGDKEFKRHVGYYLLDEGVFQLEQRVSYKPKFKNKIERTLKKYSTQIYLGGILFFTLIFESIIFTLSPSLLVALITIWPSLEIAVQLMNLLVTEILTPHLLPEMSYEEGIPESCKTLVVVPMMLLTESSIQGELERLEIRYLANADPHIVYGLLSDFTDAQTQKTEQDETLLNIAVKGVEALEAKYGSGKFFLFHRNRVWSKSENRWIGWERKRGKLEDLNRFLLGEELPDKFLYVGVRENLQGIKYVITLDSDTQLPKDKAQSLIEVITHPLNKPCLEDNGRSISRGYTIIQPRVSTDFVYSKVSLFSDIYSDDSGVNPYTEAVSDIYQDLTSEGTYHGKGIYDLRCFQTILANRFPNEHILSHDLLEGAYVRTGFASDINLFDAFPENYFTWTKRQHRWIRGDWQIVDWLWKTVPTLNGREKNPLSFLNRWKIFDNLRRSLVPISLLVLFLSGWLFSAIPGFLTLWGIVVLGIPAISLFLLKLFKEPLNLVKSWKDLFLSVERSFVMATLLPQQAVMSLDAIFRVLYRRNISHNNLLEWVTFLAPISADNAKRFLIKLSGVSFFALFTFLLILFIKPQITFLVLPFCFLWFISPFVVAILDQKPRLKTITKLTDSDRKMLRIIARKTWRYFDDLVGPQSHWLPPDNYQTALNVEIAQRTSPTNIGLWMISALSAYDLNYMTCDELIERTTSTMHQLAKLERFEGHLLNWYNTLTLNPLYPRYISTVDSGNLIACLWTIEEGLNQILTNPIIPENFFEGIQDILNILKHDFEIPSSLKELENDFKNSKERIPFLRKALETVRKETDQNYWLQALEKQLSAWDQIISRYLEWVDILGSISPEKLNLIHPKASEWYREALKWMPSFEEVSKGAIPQALQNLLNGSERDDLPKEVLIWNKRIKESFAKAQWLAGEMLGSIQKLREEIRELSTKMNLRFLYNNERKLFAIGYNADNLRLDNSFYDLLASEARLASLIAIAKEDVPLEHWWALGRPYGRVEGKRILLSWGGTMFEYLMPLLFTKNYEESLLGEACQTAVECQIAYGNKLGIPWGVSEAAFAEIDTHKIYQYRSFGVPGLGLKRNLEEDLVVSPYSTALALMINASASIHNLKKMGGEDHLDMRGSYGYYESVDFTRQLRPTGERGVIVYAFMAHHQGMFFISLNNLLNKYIIRNRFHADPRIKGVEFLLYERIPVAPSISKKDQRKEVPVSRLTPFSALPIMGMMDTPESVMPKVNLLSNGKYSLMITNSGGGYSSWGDIDITRWRSDTTQDGWGSFIYIKDVRSRYTWSTTYHPLRKKGGQYSVLFKSDKAEFHRKDFQIDTITEVFVTPEDQAEIRLVTLVNHSKKTRYLELTSYIELVLAPHATDRQHPSFNKMFIETEAVPEHGSLIAFRRQRSPTETPLWAAHVIAVNHDQGGEFQFETDRNNFIGRGRTLENPQAMEGNLSNTSGTVLDPIFSLRCKVAIDPGKRIQVSFVTLIADNKVSAIALSEKYKHLEASLRAQELAWNYAHLELRHLRIQQEEAQLFQKLASRVLYPHLQLRAASERLRSNKLGQSSLWKYGISGDLPIVVVTIGDLYESDIVKQVLIAHTFWRLRGLKTDLVILNEESPSYEHPLQEHLKRMIFAYTGRAELNVTGGVFLIGTQEMPEEDLTLIFSIARAILPASRGSLRQQLVAPLQLVTYPPNLIVNKKLEDFPSKLLPYVELSHFNDFGGFTPDGKIYSIYLGPGKSTPRPWINVIANRSFGMLVTEAGLGCTWFENSQNYRLTPWSNDPVLNPVTDCLYIRDEERGNFWTPTPSPIRENDPYRISHGHGFSRFEHNSHGIEQFLEVGIPSSDIPIRIQKLRLKNSTSRVRRLSVTAYSEWVLGTTKEETQIHIFTEWDEELQALLAYNQYHSTFASRIAFTTVLEKVHSYTGDRTEFIGRNGSLETPLGLHRQRFSCRTGTALDPCGALQVLFTLNPDEEKEIIFICGSASDSSHLHKLLGQYKDKEEIEKLFIQTEKWWDKILSTITVETPNPTADLFINRWLLYQTLSCRFWGRSAFYQSSGAYGFRDQLQDVLSLLYASPYLAREHILRCASRQFLEGDVQHWWHPATGEGVRTKISDDLLWLPFATAQYVRVTGDRSILEEDIPFLQAPLLSADQHELYLVPQISEERGSLLEHCLRTIQRGATKGPHDLPLIGTGDWNDGMNRVGLNGVGESVWLGWFLIHVLKDFAEMLQLSGNNEVAQDYLKARNELAEAIEKNAWDGSWYIRAYFDDGAPLGSHTSPEAKIDAIAQAWAILSGKGNQERSLKALQSTLEYLVKKEHKMVLLLTPPFDKSTMDPGYIKGYPPGVRENGSQYTHGSLWLPMAFARAGLSDKAVELLNMMLPVNLSLTPLEALRYEVEPYVMAADINSLLGHEGRGGWTWYTGSSGWMYRIWLEEILGFKLRGQILQLDPKIPSDWKQFKIHYTYLETVYHIHVERGNPQVILDGISLPSGEIPLVNDKQDHTIQIAII